jgi:hypothetical protein
MPDAHPGRPDPRRGQGAGKQRRVTGN